MAGLKNIIKRIRPLYKCALGIRAYTMLTPKINLWKTIYINFRTQRFKDAIKFPIWVYGSLKIRTLHGKITLKGPIKSGRFRIGHNSDAFSAQKGGAMLTLFGEIVSHGKFSCSVDCLLEIYGTLEVEDEAFFGNMSKVRCIKYIYFGKKSRMASECQAFDTNFHFTKNVETGIVHPRLGKIIVGDYCWIGNRTSLMKGTVLPSYSIVASNSLCNKDYSAIAPKYPLIGGMPAKVIGNGGNVRVFDMDEEIKISQYFGKHPDSLVYQSEIGIK